MAKEHRLVFANDGFEVSVEAEGISEERWAALVLAIVDEIRRPEARLELRGGGD